ncbi:hypothetical protein VCRA2113O325_180011 [Vibrio crassostreae]|nr:hypothetical protein VCRA2113O322_190065 [Vibrio crassostreae]CAK1944160.1 hypothetical protein VCRA2113O326_210010 [Vibrio crassostreae]CAK2668128.1 hypothetical protein VCRA2113O325_180011 [Vibrio crassostreae]CAK2728276.1 hypothetical protein VCRA2113O323_200065 [Vibrio crassostreae]CAK2740150.1 hypothetical protein VCRA2113O321_210010 [Vibrio crassostreae]
MSSKKTIKLLLLKKNNIYFNDNICRVNQTFKHVLAIVAVNKEGCYVMGTFQRQLQHSSVINLHYVISNLLSKVIAPEQSL